MKKNIEQKKKVPNASEVVKRNDFSWTQSIKAQEL